MGFVWPVAARGGVRGRRLGGGPAGSAAAGPGRGCFPGGTTGGAISANLVPGYRDLSILHRGASAVVYRAVHEESGDVVALRVQGDGGEPSRAELDALVRASRDEHLVTVRETGRTVNGRRYTALAYCDGDTYRGPLPVPEAVSTVTSVGKALRALHAEGLLHGDVRPGRVFRGDRGPLLSGAATVRGLEPLDLQRVDMAYAAPEVLRRRAQTAAADVYGLGATLWSLLAGRPPFTGSVAWSVREKALRGPVPPVPRDDVPERLTDLLMSAMADNPGERPTAAAFVQALEAADDATGLGEPVAGAEWSGLAGWSWDADDVPADEAPEVRRDEPPQERPRRLGGVVAAVVAFAVLGVALGVGALMSGSGTAGEAPRAEPASSVPTSTPTAVRPVKEYVPGRVRIVDARVTIEVSWQDRSGGKAAFYVVGGPDGRPASTLATVPAGTEKVVVTALNPSVDYCLTVVAVVDVDRVAQAEPVCTRRVERG